MSARIGDTIHLLTDTGRAVVATVAWAECGRVGLTVDAAAFEAPPLTARRRSRPRSVSDVLEARRHAAAGGCCDRFADQQGCDCLERAQCSICHGPNCREQGQKH